jgi:hypothetical protein
MWRTTLFICSVMSDPQHVPGPERSIEKKLDESRRFILYAQRIDQQLANGAQLAQYVFGNGLVRRRVTDRCAPALRQWEV